MREEKGRVRERKETEKKGRPYHGDDDDDDNEEEGHAATVMSATTTTTATIASTANAKPRLFVTPASPVIVGPTIGNNDTSTARYQRNMVVDASSATTVKEERKKVDWVDFFNVSRGYGSVVDRKCRGPRCKKRVIRLAK